MAQSLTLALKEARLAEAAQLDALMNVNDARRLRLEALRDAVLPELLSNPAAVSLFDINLQDGEKPRLWIDLISSVEMEPDPKSYRLVQGRAGSWETLFETRDAAQMQRHVIRYLAQRMVAQEKRAAALRASLVDEGGHRYGFGELVYVWFTGFLFGVLGLIAYGLSTGALNFHLP